MTYHKFLKLILFYVINGSTLVFEAEYYATTSYIRPLHAYTLAFLHDKLSSSSRVHS